MRTSLTFVATLALSTGAFAGHGYVRPQVAWVIPTAGTADPGYGLFAGLGYAFGPGDHHDLELEIGWCSWKLTHTSDYGTVVWDEQADCRLAPVLVNYRYRGKISSALTGYLQAGAGLADAKTDIAMRSNQGGQFRGSEKDRTAVAALGAGLAWRLTEHASAHLCYRYMSVASLELDLFDTDIELSALDSDLHVLEAGLTFRY